MVICGMTNDRMPNTNTMIVPPNSYFLGHNADWSDQPEDFESFCDNFILLPTLVGILLCMARFIDQMSASQKPVR